MQDYVEEQELTPLALRSDALVSMFLCFYLVI